MIMSKVKKTWFSILLLVSLILTAIPVNGYAAEDDLAINKDSFPDEIFREYVETNFDTNADGLLSKTELENVTYISVSQKEIKSLKGIENFANLSTLICIGNQLTELDVSQNVNLDILRCDMNPLTEIDLRNNTKLMIFGCQGDKLNSLDVSNNKMLQTIRCWHNNIKTLDISNNIYLQTLECSNNNLSELDLSKNTALKSLDCTSNPLIELDVSNNTLLETLLCQNTQIKKLDIQNNKELITLECSENQIESLNLQENKKLVALSCGSNPIKSIDLSMNTALVNLDVNNFYEGLSTTTYTGIDELDLSNNLMLEKIDCGGNNLKTLDVSNNLLLKDLRCNDNELSNLDLRNNVNLESINCERNKLTTLDIKENQKLSWICCSGNQLTSLDVSNNSLLETIYAKENVYNIELSPSGTFELSNLLGDFDVNRASNWIGGKVTDNILTVDPGTEEIKYIYDCGNSYSISFTLKHSHSFGPWKSDEKQHWRECVCGGKNNVNSHIPSEVATATTPQICTECGYVITPAYGGGSIESGNVGGGVFIPPVQKPIIEAVEGADVSLSADGTTAIIQPREGYEVKDVLINGVSQGKMTEIKGLKTGDKVTVVVEKVEVSEDNSELIAKIEATELITRSKISMVKGKPVIKVYWNEKEDSGVSFDGYEVYRSIKRTKGYGKTPIFTTKKEQYFNTAVKKGITYYYKVRGFVEINGEKVYTDWSSKAWRTIK